MSSRKRTHKASKGSPYQAAMEEWYVRLRDAYAALDTQFYFLHTGKKNFIASFARDPDFKHARLAPMSLQVFRDLHLNKTIAGEPDKATLLCKQVSAVELWLHWKERRTFHGVQCEPIEAKQDPRALQLWRGFAIEANDTGDWTLIKDHTRNVICSGNDEHFAYVLRFIAWIVQHPGEQAEIALVLKGEEGAGKGVFVQCLLRLFGEHGLHVTSPDQVVGHFNAHLRSVLLLFADEALFAGNPSIRGKLYGLITEKTLMIEGKFEDQMPQRCRVTLIMATNNEWAVPAGPESRRFAVFYVPSDKIRDRAYFTALWAAVDDPMALGAMRKELEKMDLTGFEIRDPPVTDELRNQRRLSASTPLHWLGELLETGELPYMHSSDALNGRGRPLGSWEPTSDLLESYRAWCGANRVGRPDHSVLLGKALAKVCKPQREGRNERGKDRRRGYEFGALDDARRRYATLTGFESEQPGPDPDQEDSGPGSTRTTNGSPDQPFPSDSPGGPGGLGSFERNKNRVEPGTNGVKNGFPRDLTDPDRTTLTSRSNPVRKRKF